MQEKKIHLAHQAMMLEDAYQLLANNRQQVKAHGRMMCDLPQLPEHEMGIHIGDVHVAPQAAPAKAGMSTLGKLLIGTAIGAGLLTTGGAGALAIAALLKPATPMELEIPWQWQDGKMHFGKPREIGTSRVTN